MVRPIAGRLLFGHRLGWWVMFDAVSERLSKVGDELASIVDARGYDSTAPLIAARGVLESQRDRIK